jgi:exopolysaccharide biosynthesis WecB/TagA/CpsF family protein
VATVEQILGLIKKYRLKVLLIGGRYVSDISSMLDVEIDSEIKVGGKLRIEENDIFYIEGYKNILLPTQSEIKAVQMVIAGLKPRVVLVALGAPVQEKWLVENRALMAKMGVRLGMAVGGSFDFLLGKVKRAPKKWQSGGWEWLWRLGQEPHRWRRQLALPKFVLLHWLGKWKDKER